MRRRSALTLTALACVLALAGCRGSSPRSAPGGAGGGRVVAGGTDAFVPQLNSFTDELLSKVESAPDTKAGVAEAQAHLDARRDDFASAIAALKRSAPDAGSKAKLLEAEVDNTDRVHRLQLKYADAAARDAGLKAGLERLIDDYDALFR
jgi:hypothetical protein